MQSLFALKVNSVRYILEVRDMRDAETTLAIIQDRAEIATSRSIAGR